MRTDARSCSQAVVGTRACRSRRCPTYQARRDELDSLKAFLGRAPSSEAFTRKMLAGAPKP